jgi:hypothetical protein
MWNMFHGKMINDCKKTVQRETLCAVSVKYGRICKLIKKEEKIDNASVEGEKTSPANAAFMRTFK